MYVAAGGDVFGWVVSMIGVYVDEVWLHIKRLVAAMIAAQPQPKRGTIASVDPTTMRARVLMYSGLGPATGQLTGWLPILSPCIGAGWGLVASPPIGAQVLVVPVEGSPISGVVVGGHWSNAQLPPSGYAVGEIVLQHESGATVQMTNAGAVTMTDQHNATVILDGTGKVLLEDASGSNMSFTNNGTITINGNLVINGNVNGNGAGGTGTTNWLISGNITATGTIS